MGYCISGMGKRVKMHLYIVTAVGLRAAAEPLPLPFGPHVVG